MRRALVALIAAVPLFLGTATASANLFGSLPIIGNLPIVGNLLGNLSLGSVPTGTLPTSITDLLSPKAVVTGTVVSTDAADGTFVANASSVNPFQFVFGFGLGGSTTQSTSQVTVTVGSGTLMLVNGRPGSVGDLIANEKFVGLFNGMPTDSVQTLTANPPVFLFAHGSPTTLSRQVYGFVGTVTGLDTSGGTVSVNLTDAFPSDLANPGSPATFTVGTETLILGRSSGGSLLGGLGGSLSDVSVGDIVAGGLVAPSGDTLTQVEALPLNVLLDVPAPSTSLARRSAKARAFKEALALLRGHSVSKKHHRHHRRHHHHS